MTPQEPSQANRKPWGEVHTLPAMPYAVGLRLDPAGVCPLILTEDSEPLPGGDDVRYRFVTELDDLAEAARLAGEIQENSRQDSTENGTSSSPASAPARRARHESV
jgi:hypothetical protein